MKAKRRNAMKITSQGVSTAKPSKPDVVTRSRTKASNQTTASLAKRKRTPLVQPRVGQRERASSTKAKQAASIKVKFKYPQVAKKGGEAILRSGKASRESDPLELLLRNVLLSKSGEDQERYEDLDAERAAALLCSLRESLRRKTIILDMQLREELNAASMLFIYQDIYEMLQLADDMLMIQWAQDGKCQECGGEIPMKSMSENMELPRFRGRVRGLIPNGKSIPSLELQG